MNRKKTASPINFIFGILTLIYVAIAITQQLQRPPEERTWYGKIAGIPSTFDYPRLNAYAPPFGIKTLHRYFYIRPLGLDGP